IGPIRREFFFCHLLYPKSLHLLELAKRNNGLGDGGLEISCPVYGVLPFDKEVTAKGQVGADKDMRATPATDGKGFIGAVADTHSQGNSRGNRRGQVQRSEESRPASVECEFFASDLVAGFTQGFLHRAEHGVVRNRVPATFRRRGSIFLQFIERD